MDKLSHIWYYWAGESIITWNPADKVSPAIHEINLSRIHLIWLQPHLFQHLFATGDSVEMWYTFNVALSNVASHGRFSGSSDSDSCPSLITKVELTPSCSGCVSSSNFEVANLVDSRQLWGLKTVWRIHESEWHRKHLHISHIYLKKIVFLCVCGQSNKVHGSIRLSLKSPPCSLASCSDKRVPLPHLCLKACNTGVTTLSCYIRKIVAWVAQD